MTYDEAIRRLRDGGAFVDLAEAIGIVADESASTLEDIILGLAYPGYVQEQA